MDYTVKKRFTPYGYIRYHVTIKPDTLTSFTVKAYAEQKKETQLLIKYIINNKDAYPKNHFELSLP